jgi:hypothetical protein
MAKTKSTQKRANHRSRGSITQPDVYQCLPKYLKVLAQTAGDLVDIYELSKKVKGAVSTQEITAALYTRINKRLNEEDDQ